MSGASSGFNGTVIRGVGSKTSVPLTKAGKVRTNAGGVSAAQWGRDQIAKAVAKSTLGNAVKQVVK